MNRVNNLHPWVRLLIGVAILITASRLVAGTPQRAGRPFGEHRHADLRDRLPPRAAATTLREPPPDNSKQIIYDCDTTLGNTICATESGRHRQQLDGGGAAGVS